MTLSLDIATHLDSFQLSVKAELPGRGITAIYGPSGCGKTTLLRCLAGLQPCQGSAAIDNVQVHSQARRERQIGYIFQEDRLFPHLTVEGNLQFAYQRRFNRNGPTIDQVIAWLELNHLRTQYPAKLSGGQRKRVAIARALLSSPRCLMLDEPLSGLDEAASYRILHYLSLLSAELGIPMLYVSHHLDEITRIADHLLILEKGGVAANGPLLEMLSRLDLDINHKENSATILNGEITGRDQQHGLSILTIDGGSQLWLSGTTSKLHGDIRVRIPARDVSLTLSQPTETSILNILPATIIDICPVDNAQIIVKSIVAGSHQSVLARITRKSLDQLGLTQGQSVYLQIKSVALISDQNF